MLIINLFGGPGAGKSTTAAGVFYQLKQQGRKVEYVPENAKWFTYEGRSQTLSYQAYVHAKQLRDLERLQDHVDIAVTDSPTLLSCIYGRIGGKYPESFYDFVVEQFRSMPSLNFFIERVNPYAEYGRNQTEGESDEIADDIASMLAEYRIPYLSIAGDSDAVSRVLSELEAYERGAATKFVDEDEE